MAAIEAESGGGFMLYRARMVASTLETMQVQSADGEELLSKRVGD